LVSEEASVIRVDADGAVYATGIMSRHSEGGAAAFGHHSDAHDFLDTSVKSAPDHGVAVVAIVLKIDMGMGVDEHDEKLTVSRVGEKSKMRFGCAPMGTGKMSR